MLFPTWRNYPNKNSSTQKPPRCSRWGGLPPHRYYRTVHETRVADLTRLLRIQAFVTGTTTTISTRHRSVSEPVGPENGFSRLRSVLRRVSSDPGPASADPFRYPRPTSASPGHDTGPLL